jgi:hypothetical protein
VRSAKSSDYSSLSPRSNAKASRQQIPWNIS